MSGSVTFTFDPRFPFSDVAALGRKLQTSGHLVPGFTPPSVGYLDIAAIRCAHDLEGWNLVVMADRNFISRLAQACRLGAGTEPDDAQLSAVRLMAFCKAMDLDIDPSISFHELAQVQGKTAALDELAWFRAADRGGDAQAWIDFAFGRTSALTVAGPAPRETADLARPLRRWRRNYVAALKIAGLELDDLKPAARFERLIDWMYEDFQLCGPAALFAAVYFSGRRPSKMMKGLRGNDRTKALAGVRNAAWDITYLSYFADAVQASEARHVRTILATRDDALAAIAPLVLLGPEPEDYRPSLGQALKQWWPAADAIRSADRLMTCAWRVQAEGPRPLPQGASSIEDMTTEMEARLLAWRPATG
ncbi:hypothetical protein [Phenylobacterium sp.]|uniref:hypothetical protein n=1 Tax=Phenylobacterium sp. TaxID=1871053 RepID=UPI003002755C